MAMQVTITNHGLQAGTDRTLYVMWKLVQRASSTQTNSYTQGGTIPPEYYPKASSKYRGYFVAGLDSIGVPSSKAYRTDIAALNGYPNYTGSSSQNIDLSNKLCNGTLLKRPGSSHEQVITTTTTTVVPGAKDYTVKWEYFVNNIWFEGTTQTTTSNQSLWTAPANALKARCTVMPNPEDYQSNGETVNAWSGGWSTPIVFDMKDLTPTFKSTPSLALSPTNPRNVVARVDGVTAALNTTHIQFKLVIDGGNTVQTTGNVEVRTNSASYTFTGLASGNMYKVQARGYNSRLGSDGYGEWTDYSGLVSIAPIIQNAPTLTAKSANVVRVSWKKDITVDSYRIDYADQIQKFNAGAYSSITISNKEVVNYDVTVDSTGKTWYFRVVGINSAGESVPPNTSIASVLLGLIPEAPTTWSMVTNVIVGDTVNFYWTHNSEDGSKMSAAQILLTFDDGHTQTLTYPGPFPGDDDEEGIYTMAFSTSAITEGASIKWKVRTMGALKKKLNSTVDAWSPWSVTRELYVYSRASMNIVLFQGGDPVEEVGDYLTMLPLKVVNTVVNNGAQKPTGYYISIFANDGYETVDFTGEKTQVSAGQRLFYRYYRSDEIPFEAIISAMDMNLQNGMGYTLYSTVSLDSGMTAESSVQFIVNWSIPLYNPEASVTINEDYSATIHPYCYNYDNNMRSIDVNQFTGDPDWISYCVENNYIHEVTVSQDTDGGYITTVKSNAPYILIYNDITNYISDIRNFNTLEVFNTIDDNVMKDCSIRLLGYDSRGQLIINRSYSGFFANEATSIIDLSDISTVSQLILQVNINNITKSSLDFFFAVRLSDQATAQQVEEYTENVLLSVYRREFDGTYTEIASGLNNSDATYVTDPHPSLDYARYRVIATDKDTGAISFADIAPTPVQIKAVIIQWNEEWSNYTDPDRAAIDTMAEQMYDGSVLVLPYNIDVSESSDVDVSLVKYIGRRHPVSYHGTQVGQTANWNVEIDRKDAETLYQLRRLQIWQDSVYVREPSGLGYWASIKVSLSQTHRELTIPVSLEITRVDGGV